VIRHVPEHRYAERLLWRHPVLMAAELAEYAELDGRIEGGAACGLCEKALGYPLVELRIGWRDLHLHPECAESLAAGILRDLEEIDDRKEGF